MSDPVKHHVRTIAQSVAALREAHPPTGGLGWNFDGFRVWVESNEPALLDTLAEYFSDFRRLEAKSLAAAEAGGELTRVSAIECEPPDFGAERTMTIGEYKPSVRGPKEAYYDVADGRVVHKLRTGMWFLFSRDAHLAIGPCTQNPNQVVNFINNRMIQWALHRGALLGHASAVCHHGELSGEGEAEALPRALAIAGFSGMGKSTLALELMNERRLDFLSNDRVMIGPPPASRGAAAPGGALEIQGVPKHPRINPGTILNNPDLVGLLDEQERARLAALPGDELWELEDKYDGLIRTCFPAQRFVLRGRLVGLVLLNWTRGGGETIARRIDLRRNTKLLPALIKKPGVFYLSGAGQAESRDIARYLEYLEGVEVLELAGGIDFEVGRRAALELLFD